jgi:hypothetical protein
MTIFPPWAVVSPILAAGMLPMITVVDPMAMVSGGPTQVAMSPTRAAGIKPINTVGQPGGIMGPPTWGIGGVPGVTIGHICISPTLAAGGINHLLIYFKLNITLGQFPISLGIFEHGFSILAFNPILADRTEYRFYFRFIASRQVYS